jgi:hypothetical protein
VDVCQGTTDLQENIDVQETTDLAVSSPIPDAYLDPEYLVLSGSQLSSREIRAEPNRTRFFNVHMIDRDYFLKHCGYQA